MRTGFKISGFGEMDRRLLAVDRAMDDNREVMAVLLAALEPVAEGARQIVPVRSGKLRREIATSDRALDAPAERGIAAYVGPSVAAEYADEVEMGRPARVEPSGREHDATRPHPYMRPSWDAEVANMPASVADGLGRLIKRAAEG
ncbi:MAG TPA: hypothetical protein VF592_03630 [Sphingomonas sp.]|jgi:hypothetical protein|uniref:hypothetical protein n=1 Tax=Sphingomonas sp. TaxID=28214 RepID=UPI002ED827B4